VFVLQRVGLRPTAAPLALAYIGYMSKRGRVETGAGSVVQVATETVFSRGVVLTAGTTYTVLLTDGTVLTVDASNLVRVSG